MALIGCPGCGKEVSEQAQTCPDCGHPVAESTRARDKLLGFGVIVVVILALVAVSSMLQNTRSSPSANRAEATTPETISEPAPTPELWTADLHIIRPAWSKSEFGVAEWSLRIRNASTAIAYKDVHFKTTYWAPSGTKVDESFIGHTEYIVIPPRKTVSVHFSEFTHSQAATAYIRIDHAEVAY
jgi:predicted nucleic acid-binding Zn ribbon protein